MGVAIDEVTHRAQVRGVFGQCGNDGRVQRWCTVGVEQLQEAAREYAQMRTALGGAQEQWRCTGCGMM
jgi:hypothetical protein